MVTDIEETFDFLVGAADGLNFAKLVDGTGYRNILLNGQVGNGRQQAVIFGRRSAVAVDAAVGLFENNRSRQRQGRFLGKTVGNQRLQNQYALAVYRTAHFDFSFNVDKFALAKPDLRGNSRRLAEGITREVVHDQTVDLPDAFAFDVDEKGSFVNLFQHGLLNAVAAVNLRVDSLLDMIFADLVGF